MTDATTEQLIELASDLYQEGYVCGISGENAYKWLEAWAIAMKRVAQGEEYSSDLVHKVYQALTAEQA